MRQGHPDDGFISPELTALPDSVQCSTSAPASELCDPLDMLLRERWQPTLDIIVIDDVLCLQGTGREVEPALLSGNVALYLPEDTDIKDITLNFRCKVKLPSSDP